MSAEVDLWQAIAAAASDGDVAAVMRNRQRDVDDHAWAALSGVARATTPIPFVAVAYFLDSAIRQGGLDSKERRAHVIGACRAFFQNTSSAPFDEAPERICSITKALLALTSDLRELILPLRRCLHQVYVPRNLQTPLHTLFLLVCLRNGVYEPALPIISAPVYGFQPKNLPTPQEHLQYHYYAGMVFAALKRFPAALAEFDIVLSAVSTKLSAIQIEAYKKRALINLIVHGTDPVRLPRYCSTTVLKTIDGASLPYGTFLGAAQAGLPAFEAALIDHQATLADDKNLGLAKQAMKSLRKRQVRKLADSYLTLSLVDVAEAAGVASQDAAQALVFEMIDEGSLFASIDQQTAMLTFGEPRDDFDDEDATTALLDQLRRVNEYHDRVLEANLELATYTPYLKRVVDVPQATAAQSSCQDSQYQFA
ncbi:COP9 signalosome complex subunit 3 [Plasmodiophora brassicae]|uniref:COP9 signalosome complex subunit 3 n=1 Tax=Plasmodiophora brassicae TaxID=37360 RepID=A0A0G4INX0_PLABS|nr:hypothetical protein PBRA_005545 [Plasmodiophora brassicae]SPR01888.1 unnamed protein product [Plasmodiophora brassicae]